MKNTRNSFCSTDATLLVKLLLPDPFLVAVGCSDKELSAPASPSAPKSLHRADVAVSWLNLQLKLVRTTLAIPATGFGQPSATPASWATRPWCPA